MADEIKNTNEPLDPRVYFASERTLLAWIRTGRAMMGFGFVVARFGLFLREMATMRDVPPQSHSGLSLSAGTTLVIFGVVVNILAAVKHWRDIRRLETGVTLQTSPWSLGIIVAFLLALLGLLMATYLLVGLVEPQ
jgi:putative membrane protein